MTTSQRAVRDWKAKVRHDAVAIEEDRGAAVTRALVEDGFSLGVLFRGKEAPMEPNTTVTATIADVEKYFSVAAASS